MIVEPLATTIRLNWEKWVEEAEMVATVEQDSEAGEFHLHRLLCEVIDEYVNYHSTCSSPAS